MTDRQRPRAIFLDIDGTLALPGRTEPVPTAMEAVRRAQARGHKIFLCTGRNMAMVRPFLSYGFDGVVASAGGYVIYGDRVLYDHPMTERQRDKILALLGQEKVLRTVECLDVTYSDDMGEAFAGTDPALMNSEMLRWHEQCCRKLGIRPLEEYAGQPVYKVVFMCSKAEQLLPARAELEDQFQFCIQPMEDGGYLNGELISRAFDKGRGAALACQALGLPLEEAVAFGDGPNDLEVIQAVGTGVCMGNGSPDLKAAADLICRPIQEDGLARAFRQLGLTD